MLNIAIIGTGPTAIYTAKYLLDQQLPMHITMFESQSEAGKGTPYHQDWNTEAMLANIASIEIPPITESLVDWLSKKNDDELLELGMLRDDIDERKFYPRIVLGQYFQSQLQKLQASAKFPFTVKTNTHVDDVAVNDHEITLTLQNQAEQPVFSHVIIATGHTWPKKSEIKPGYFISPWPPTELQTIENCEVGILGTSLSAIDAMAALAIARGTFIRDENGKLNYLAEPGTEDFKITLMSRKGLLPEADFYFEFPYKPLKICTSERMNDLIAMESKTGLLDNAFMLFKAELAAADPEYAKNINLDELNLEEFYREYFRDREEHDAFIWAEKNLMEAKQNEKNKHTVEWRYAILRMHEVVAQIVPHLSAEDYTRFKNSFKSIFVDDYATVPHESIERVLALHSAGKLDILRLGADYDLDTETAEKGVILTYENTTKNFPAFIDATGQRILSARKFPFPTLWKQGIIKDATVPYELNVKMPKQKHFAIGGIALDISYHPISNSPDASRLYCPSIPFMLGQFPFSQGITSSHDIGKVIAENIAENHLEFLQDEKIDLTSQRRLGSISPQT